MGMYFKTYVKSKFGAWISIVLLVHLHNKHIIKMV